VGNQQVLIVTPATELSSKTTRLEMQTKRLHLFDAKTGLTL
jgi:hypothetical protein